MLSMICPFCGSDDVEVPTVDVGPGEVQCGPAECLTCLAYQEVSGEWQLRELIVCGPCSRAAGADRDVKHLPLACPEDAIALPSECYRPMLQEPEKSYATSCWVRDSLDDETIRDIIINGIVEVPELMNVELREQFDSEIVRNIINKNQP
jgi:hypothetical protein